MQRESGSYPMKEVLITESHLRNTILIQPVSIIKRTYVKESVQENSADCEVYECCLTMRCIGSIEQELLRQSDRDPSD
jgi:hypothetical protein